ncbi:MAG TPA: SdrD B-like domain-containing protein [Gemmataceae bacterium]
MDQLIVTLQNDVSGVQKLLAQEAAFVHQQLDHLFGITPAVPQAGSGSGSGGGVMTTALNAQNQQSKIVTPQAGSGSGSSAMTTVHENISKQQVMPLAGSGSGSNPGSGSSYYGSGSNPYSGSGSVVGNSIGSGSVSGQVWLDNNGDGIIDEGEQGYQGVTVNLDTWNKQTLMTTTTDANGNYHFGAIPVHGDFRIQVIDPNGGFATKMGADSDLGYLGYSPVFYLADKGAANLPLAGIRSTVVDTNQDDVNGIIPDEITLRDAINTVIDGPLTKPVTFELSESSQTIAQTRLSQSRPSPAPHDGSVSTFAADLNVTISLQAAPPDLSQNIKIIGPGFIGITIQGNGTANNPYRIFNVDTGVTAEIDNLTITGGYATGAGGGGILNDGTLTLKNDIIYNNHAVDTNNPQYGGGILNWIHGNLTLNNTQVSNNDDAGLGGGGIANLNTLTANSSTISENTAEGLGDGGGIYNAGNATLTNDCKIIHNSADDGGGVYNADAGYNFTMNGGTISGNYVDPDLGKGGGLYNWKGSVTLTSVTVGPINAANVGAGLYVGNESTMTTLQSVTVQGNALIGGNPQGQGIYIQNGGGDNYSYEGLNDADDPNGQPVFGP